MNTQAGQQLILSPLVKGLVSWDWHIHPVAYQASKDTLMAWRLLYQVQAQPWNGRLPKLLGGVWTLQYLLIPATAGWQDWLAGDRCRRFANRIYRPWNGNGGEHGWRDDHLILILEPDRSGWFGIMWNLSRNHLQLFTYWPRLIQLRTL